ncbi:MAG: T9SS type A sorting domain-containing protein [Phaeodactylibacter sp.]|nr:T9SS type A sorting domain-containing protein [Phaeodactylibacter sp.]
MKQYLPTLLLFVLFTAPMSAQDYQPMAIENAHWVIYNGFDYTPDPHIFAVRGDTTIGGTAYKKIYYQDLVDELYWADPYYLMEDEYLWGVMRDDTMARQVYVIAFESYDPWQLPDLSYQCPLFEEQLLYDFSASVGDTIATCLGRNWPFSPVPEGWVVDSIGTESAYGQLRRTLYSFDSDFQVPYIYEGIGSEHGFLGGVQVPTFPGTAIAGYYLYDYCVGTDEDCLIISGNEEVVIPDAQFRLAPNPVGQEAHLTISPAATEAMAFRVYNLLGQLLLQAPIPRQQTDLSIPMQDLPAGFYKFIITGDRSNHIAGKGSFVKE